MVTNDLAPVIQNILRDIRVDLSSEFDKNFERQGFFSEAWQRRKSPSNGGAILIGTGQLRRSIISKIDNDSITFSSDLPYAGIHNEGGEIKVTPKMKRFFWAKYMANVNKFGRKKNGELREDKRNAQLGANAEFWKAMALMKVGRSIRIPRRRFLGVSPEVEKAVTEIIEMNLADFFENGFSIDFK